LQEAFRCPPIPAAGNRPVFACNDALLLDEQLFGRGDVYSRTRSRRSRMRSTLPPAACAAVDPSLCEARSERVTATAVSVRDSESALPFERARGIPPA